MLVRVAEESFDKGVAALGDGRQHEALAFFEAAIELECKYGTGKPQARYLSHYGLCLGLAGRRKHEAVKFCREAVAMEGYNPDLLWNLGRALLIADLRREAYAAFVKGLRLEPGHKGIIQDLKAMGLRKRPPLPFLDRSNPINVLLGRIRSNGS
ncbi:MAG TPA: hypothetical protein VD788_05815 [Candidatus Polarisedimenticolaceae bacterium]|nr:hypothetical protein [Candidatus Polarisedimenticolaceae bacterium]